MCEKMGSVVEAEEINWRDKSVRDRLGFALTHDTVYTDVTFVVGKTEDQIAAHKLILRLSSLVFENLIASHEEKGLNIIRLPNASPPMFRRLLKFIYTDELEMKDFAHFFRVAKDFGFQKLAEQSLKILKETRITIKNAFLILEISKGMADTELEECAMAFIRKNIKNLLESEDFFQVSHDTLGQILRDDGLFVDERTLFKAVLRWAWFQCKQSKIPDTEENIKVILKDVRLYIRYLQMGCDYFTSEVKASKIFESAEYIDILKMFIDPSKNPLGISIIPRSYKEFIPPIKSRLGEYTVEYEFEYDQPIVQPQQIALQHVSMLPIPKEIKKSRLKPPPIIAKNSASRTVRLIETVPSLPSTPEKTDRSKLVFPVLDVKLDQPMLKKARTDNGNNDALFELKNCSIDFTDVLNATQLQFSIQQIILHNVFFNGLIDANKRRVYLPNLKSFVFFQEKVLSTRLPDKSFMSGLTTKEFLFFEIDKLQPWTFSNLWSLGVEIRLDVKGLRLMEINPSQKKLTLAYPVEEEVHLILESLYKQQELESLCLSACDIQSSFDLPTMELEALVLQGVTFQDGKAMSYINKCRKLRDLSVFVTDGLKVNLHSDLKVQRLTLERMALANVDLEGWTGGKSSLLTFPFLEELYLDVCSWTPCFIEHFSFLFPNVKRVVIRSKDSCRPTAHLVKKVFEMQSLEKVAFFRYCGGEDTLLNPNLDVFALPETTSKTFVLHFLKYAGLTFSNPPVTPWDDVPNFILEKESISGNWKAVSSCSTVLDEIHFRYSMLDQFFENCHVSKLIE